MRAREEAGESERADLATPVGPGDRTCSKRLGSGSGGSHRAVPMCILFRLDRTGVSHHCTNKTYAANPDDLPHYQSSISDHRSIFLAFRQLFIHHTSDPIFDPITSISHPSTRF